MFKGVLCLRVTKKGFGINQTPTMFKSDFTPTMFKSLPHNIFARIYSLH